MRDIYYTRVGGVCVVAFHTEEEAKALRDDLKKLIDRHVGDSVNGARACVGSFCTTGKGEEPDTPDGDIEF